MPDELLLLLLLVLIGGAKRKAAVTPPAAAPASGAPLQPGDLLVPGASYRATIALTGIEAMFGTAAAVKAKLQAAGFKNVNVDDKGGGSFEATGQWGGAAVAAKLPPQVKSVVRT